MALATGTRLGPYEVVAPLGASQGLFQVSAEGGAVTELTSPGFLGGVTHYCRQCFAGHLSVTRMSGIGLIAVPQKR